MEASSILDIHCDLNALIKQKRQEMIDLGMKSGFTHQATVKCSQELDQLLNFYRQHELNNVMAIA